MHYRKYFEFAFIFLFISFLGVSCSKSKAKNGTWSKKEGLIWNTSYHVTFNGAESLGDSITATLQRTGKSLSCFDSTSLVSRVNMQDSTPVNTDFIRVYVMSRRINKITGGAFDPTLSPLITAWGFGEGHTPTADTLRIDSLLKITGISRTRLFNDALIKDNPGIEFNFSAIAKGYGCDAIGEMFERNGVENYLIEIGGEILAKGHNPENGNWKISVDKPVYGKKAADHISQAVIAFSDMGMATSGNYRNTQSNGSTTYGHTISYKTGRPIQTNIISATVLSKTAMEADGFATAFMAMEKEEAVKLIERLDIPVMLIFNDSSMWCSKRFEKLIIRQ